MFFEVFEKLCRDKGITPTRASVEIGFSRGSVSYWKKNWQNGIDAKPDSKTAKMIADYFGVSVDYLLGRTDDPTDYSDDDLIASIAGPVLDHFNGDVKKAVAFQRAVAEDAARERKQPEFMKLYSRLDDVDKAKAEAFMNGLLAADKYQSQTAGKKNA